MVLLELPGPPAPREPVVEDELAEEQDGGTAAVIEHDDDDDDDDEDVHPGGDEGSDGIDWEEEGEKDEGMVDTAGEDESSEANEEDGDATDVEVEEDVDEEEGAEEVAVEEEETHKGEAKPAEEADEAEDPLEEEAEEEAEVIVHRCLSPPDRAALPSIRRTKRRGKASDLLARMVLREHPVVVAELEAWWQMALHNYYTFPRMHHVPPDMPVGPVGISFSQYVDLYCRLFRVLMDTPYNHNWHLAARLCAAKDWDIDVGEITTHEDVSSQHAAIDRLYNTVIMDRDAFMDAMFHLAETWTWCPIDAPRRFLRMGNISHSKSPQQLGFFLRVLLRAVADQLIRGEPAPVLKPLRSLAFRDITSEAAAECASSEAPTPATAVTDPDVKKWDGLMVDEDIDEDLQTMSDKLHACLSSPHRVTADVIKPDGNNKKASRKASSKVSLVESVTASVNSAAAEVQAMIIDRQQQAAGLAAAEKNRPAMPVRPVRRSSAAIDASRSPAKHAAAVGASSGSVASSTPHKLISRASSRQDSSSSVVDSAPRRPRAAQTPRPPITSTATSYAILPSPRWVRDTPVHLHSPSRTSSAAASRTSRKSGVAFHQPVEHLPVRPCASPRMYASRRSDNAQLIKQASWESDVMTHAMRQRI